MKYMQVVLIKFSSLAQVVQAEKYNHHCELKFCMNIICYAKFIILPVRQPNLLVFCLESVAIAMEHNLCKNSTFIMQRWRLQHSMILIHYSVYTV